MIPLRWKLGALAAVLATVPLAIVGVLLIDVNARTVENLGREVQLAVLDDVARAIDAELAATQDGLDAVGHVLTDPDRDPDTALALASTLVVGHEALDHAAIYDREGALIDVLRDASAEGIEIAPVLDPELRAAAERDEVATGEAVATPDGTRVAVVIPLRGAEQSLTGFALSMASLEGVERRVERIAGERFPGIAASVMVVDDRMRIVLHADPRLAHGLPSARGLGILEDVDLALLERGFSRSGEYDAGDERMLASARAVPGRRWVVVAQVPTAVAYASLGQMRLIVGITIAIAIAMALAAGLLMSRRITAPIAQLVQMARALAERRFDRRAGVQTKDELSILGAAMDRAADDLAASDQRIKDEVAIRTDLGRYLPAQVVDRVVRREQDMALGGVRRSISVLFADVVGFTPMTERLRPEETVTVLNELFTIMTEIVFRHDGTVDKFVGDSVMAIWGAPSECEDHAIRAISAADDMLRFLETGATAWRERYGVEVRLAIGVHSGECVVGNIGSSTRMEYTAIGDVVNVASRLETLARPNQILISDATREAIGDAYDVNDLGEQALSGRRAALRVYEVIT